MKIKMRTLAIHTLGLVITGACLYSPHMKVHACSRTLWKAVGQPVLVGRTMDWTGKMGTKLHMMPKGMVREGMTDENPLKWTSKYGSVVATIWDGATADGVNEAGLNANLLYLAETKYGQRDPSRPGLSVSLWAQYFLDNFATVAEAVEAADSFQVQSFELIHLGEIDLCLHSNAPRDQRSTTPGQPAALNGQARNRWVDGANRGQITG